MLSVLVGQQNCKHTSLVRLQFLRVLGQCVNIFFGRHTTPGASKSSHRHSHTGEAQALVDRHVQVQHKKHTHRFSTGSCIQTHQVHTKALVEEHT
jgi:hypothetical protein